MTNQLAELALPWISRQLGYPIEYPSKGKLLAVRAGPEGSDPPLIGFRIDTAVAFSVSPAWVDRVRILVSDLHPDQTFSVLGAYELSRITLPDGVAVWGPIPNYVADANTWRPLKDRRPVLLTDAQLAAVDWNVFWHCERNSPIAAFGIYEGETLVALATVEVRGGGLMEIGVDVAPGRTGQKLGSAVVSAAGNWIHDNGGIIHATVAFWNVPSSRNMRALGMHYVFSFMRARKGPFLVPPQPIGKPLPGVAVQDAYPRWAMNSEILPKPE